MADVMLTPVNTISREELFVLLTNYRLNNSVEFSSDCDCDKMETDSPIRKQKGLPIGKKLFHSPMANTPNELPFNKTSTAVTRKAKKRKQTPLEGNDERFQRVYVKECDKDSYSPDTRGGIRKKVLISLFHNKEYSMELSG